MTILYTDNIELINASNLNGFFKGWPSHPSNELHYEILKGSFKVWLALDENKCVGFINAISDGIFSAFIPLFEVIPEYQHQGVGKILAEKMVGEFKDHYSIDLLCDSSIVPFYEKLGFQRGAGMSIRNYESANGSK